MKMKQYKVEVWDEQGGYYFIKAENEEEARKKGEQMLEDDVKMDNIASGDRSVLSVKEIK